MSRSTKRLIAIMLMIAATTFVAAGCGSDDSESSNAAKKSAKAASSDAMEKTDDAMEKTDDAMEKTDDAMEKTGDAMAKRTGTLDDVQPQLMLQAKKSKFGTVLWDQHGQVVYAFESDKPGTSNCYGDCADFWPPLLTKDAPKAMSGVDQAKLGTTKRKDGSTQVTYNGWPLYYMNEPAGEIQCHNHELHGGLWWVIAPSGDPVKTGKS